MMNYPKLRQCYFVFCDIQFVLIAMETTHRFVLCCVVKCLYFKTTLDWNCHYTWNSKRRLFVWLSLTDLWLERSSVALKLWEKSWKRNVPNSQTWTLAKPNFTSTRRTSEEEKPLTGSSTSCFFLGYPAIMTRLVGTSQHLVKKGKKGIPHVGQFLWSVTNLLSLSVLREKWSSLFMIWALVPAPGSV